MNLIGTTKHKPMNLEDTLILQSWLRSNASLAEIESANPIGLVGNQRFSESAVRAYRLIWNWTAFRFSSPEQNRVYNKCGHQFVARRIARVQEWVEKFTKLV